MESLVCMPSVCGGRLSRGLDESTAVMKLEEVRLAAAEQTNAGRTKVLRTRFADTAGVRLVRWLDRSSDWERVRQRSGYVWICNTEDLPGVLVGCMIAATRAASSNVQFLLVRNLYVSRPNSSRVERFAGGSTAIAGFGNYKAPPLASESVTEAKKLNCRPNVNNRKRPSSMGVVKKNGKAERSDDTEANNKVQRLKKAAATAEQRQREAMDWANVMDTWSRRRGR